MTLSPAEHYIRADALLAELAEVDANQFGLPFVRSKAIRADLHARLAQCPAHYSENCQPLQTIETRQPTGERV